MREEVKKDYILIFPKGMCGEQTIKVHVSPFAIQRVVAQILETQELVFGLICLVKERTSDDILAVAVKHHGVQFFTEDNDLSEEIEFSVDK